MEYISNDFSVDGTNRFSRVDIQSVKRKRVLVQACLLSLLLVGLSVRPLGELWKNG